MECPECQCDNREHARFCDACGCELTAAASKATPSHATGERKHATVMFSDLSGYTAMTEKLDPEEVKNLMGRIFAEAGKIVEKYDGTVERFFGDEVMALFGVPVAHEDDPVRAVRAALEIHSAVEHLGDELKPKLGRKLHMHTGINSGLVVTGDEQIGKGRHGLTGDTINLAKRLTGLAGAGEVFIGPDTFQQSQAFFTTASLEPTSVKGKAEPVKVYKVLSPKGKPENLHRMQGVRADLVGREDEISVLSEALKGLKEGRGAIIAIVGDAGCGKSRLVREFKAGIDSAEIQWREGHAYGYTGNTSYYPLVDLLARAFRIEDGDTHNRIRFKIESGLADLLGGENKAAQYISGLFSLSYPEVETVSPEFWKTRLFEAVQNILNALVKGGPAVICFEDLHWADPSFVELLRKLVTETEVPVLFILVYRPVFTLFDSDPSDRLPWPYREIRVSDLSSDNTQEMLTSLLETDSLPERLRDFVKDKVEGNPFYLEEVINSLIDTGTLVHNDEKWTLARPISDADIPATIHGVLSARLDRLQKEAKRILQEASVIGRAFYYEILKRITDCRAQCDQCLSGLKQLDLIRERNLHPDLEYIFKHALTQEVAYNGILLQTRKEIHERIAVAIETLFNDRLAEFYEALAFHFSRGESIEKAVKYLVRSGEKSLSRYSVEESHRHFKDAFTFLSNKPDRSPSENQILIDLINSWGYAFYYTGNFREMIALLENNEDIAKTLNDNSRYGMLCAWLGIGYFMAGKPEPSYTYLTRAISLGEKSDDQKVVGYACAWLAFTCPVLGNAAKGIEFGQRAQKISEQFPADLYLYFKSLAGIGYCHYYLGNSKQTLECGQNLIVYGKEKANSRSISFGYFILGWGHLARGDTESAIHNGKKSMEASKDPIYEQFSKLPMGLAYVMEGRFQEAGEVLAEGITFSERYGVDEINVFCQLFYGAVLIAEGQMKTGMKMIENARENIRSSNRVVMNALSEFVLGKVYLEIAFGPKPKLGVIAKNIGFVARHAPFAVIRAIRHFNNFIEKGSALNAKGFVGQAHLELGLVYSRRKKPAKARNHLKIAIQVFQECEADVFLKQAQELFDSI